MNYPTQQDKDNLLAQSELTSCVGVDAYVRGVRDALALMRELNPEFAPDTAAEGVADSSVRAFSAGSLFGAAWGFQLCSSCGKALPVGNKPLICNSCGFVNF